MTKNLCRVSGAPLTKVLDFGMQPLGNGFLEAKDFKGEYFFPMEIGYCEVSMMLQLIEQPAPEKCFTTIMLFIPVHLVLWGNILSSLQMR